MRGRFALTPELYRKLCDLVKKRDQELWFHYLHHFGIYPPADNGQVHHVIHKGSGGPDREDNLVFLPADIHLFHCHSDSWKEVKVWEELTRTWLSHPAVKAWRKTHEGELQAIYEKADDAWYRRQRKRHQLKNKT